MRVALAQFDSRLGDLDGNLARIGELVAGAEEAGADLVVFPELATHGYALGRIADTRPILATDRRLTGVAAGRAEVLVGFHEDGGIRTHNSAALLSNREAIHVQRKLYLPNYGDWEERKHTSPGQTLRAFDTSRCRMATLICNDAWQAPLPWLAAQDGAEMLLVPACSAGPETPGSVPLVPGGVDCERYWSELLVTIARMQQCWVVFVNRVGREAGVCFWGSSRVLDPTGEVVALAPRSEPALVLADVDLAATRRHRRALPLLAEARLSLVDRELRRLLAAGGDA